MVRGFLAVNVFIVKRYSPWIGRKWFLFYYSVDTRSEGREAAFSCHDGKQYAGPDCLIPEFLIASWTDLTHPDSAISQANSCRQGRSSPRTTLKADVDEIEDHKGMGLHSVGSRDIGS